MLIIRMLRVGFISLQILFIYETTCPTCGDTIYINGAMLEEGSINCPNCDELLEFDLDEDDDDEEASSEE